MSGQKWCRQRLAPQDSLIAISCKQYRTACSLPLPAGGSVLDALHRLEEFVVGLGVLQTIQQEFDGSDLVHGMQYLAQDPHALQLILAGQQLFTTGAGA